MSPKMRGKNEWPQTVRVGNASVKIYRIAHHAKQGWIYVLAWVTAAGRKREKFADIDEAMRQARLKAGQLNAGRVEGASMTTGDRDELQAARAICGAVPLIAALQEWAKARDISDGHVIPAAESWAARNVTKNVRVKVADVVREFLAAKTKAKIKTEKNHGHIFEDIKTAFGEAYIDTISAPQINAWLSRWELPGTRNTFRKHTVGLWRWAQKQNYLARGIKTEAEHADRVPEAQHKRGTIAPVTLRALLRVIQKDHAEYLPALVLSTFCGLRRGEVHAQSWEHIDLVGRTLTVTKAKEGTPAERAVPLPRAAVAWLMKCPSRTGEVCENLAVDRIRDIGRTANLTLPENCFRHSFITYRCKLTTVAQVADEAGNSPTIIRKHYRNVLADNRPMRKAEARAWFESGPDEVGQVIPMEKAAG
jgi:integrase